jgi:hypothetical protein
MLEEQDVTSVVGDVEPAPVSELSPLAERLDGLATWLYWVAGLVLACAFVSGLIVLSTNADTFGLVSPQVETDGRVAVALALIAGGFAGAGIVAGLAGILKALVRRREL